MTQIVGTDGKVAEVDSENRLQTLAVTEPFERHLNTEGKVWSIYFTVTPTGANDLFFYLKNTGTKDLFISNIRVSSTVATTLFYREVTGTASAGTDAAITNRKLGSPTLPTAIIQSDPDFTGLTSGGILFHEEIDTVDALRHLNIACGIIIPQGQAIAFERVAATGAIECVVSLSEAEQ